MSDTPRTDGIIYYPLCDGGECVPKDFARELEQEADALRALASELLEMVEEYHDCDWDEEPFTPDIGELRARLGKENEDE